LGSATVPVAAFGVLAERNMHGQKPRPKENFAALMTATGTVALPDSSAAFPSAEPNEVKTKQGLVYSPQMRQTGGRQSTRGTNLILQCSGERELQKPRHFQLPIAHFQFPLGN